jgi:predicted ATPase
MTGSAQGKDIWLEAVRIRGDEYPDTESYPFDVPAFQGRQELRFEQSVAFLVGENGSGKSTLIEAVARRCGLHLWSPQKRSGGTKDGRSGGGTSSTRAARALSDYIDVALGRGPVRGGVFTAESFREWAEFLDDVTEIDPGQARFHGGQKLTLRSRGEGLLAYFRGRYQTPGLYFMDEPEAALSPASQLDLLRLLTEYKRQGHAQFVIATHSPVLMAVRGAQVFALGDGRIEETTYEQTSHYRLYRDFMADPSRFVSD